MCFDSCGVLNCAPEEDKELEDTSPASGSLSGIDSPNSPLSADARAHVQLLLSHMDINGDGSDVTIEEALEFWKATLPDAAIPETAAHRTSPSSEVLQRRQSEPASEDADHVHALFIDMDVDLDGRLTLSEFLGFFERMKTRGYEDEDVAATCEAIVANGTWTAWKANRCIASIPAWELGATDAASCRRDDGPACSEFLVADMRGFEFEPSDGELLGPCPNIDHKIDGDSECESRGSPQNRAVKDGRALRERQGDAHDSSSLMQQEAERAEFEPHPSAGSRDSRERLDRAMWIWNRVLTGHKP